MQHWWSRLLSFFKSGESSNVGQQGEDVATGFLKAAGYKILARNHRSTIGELDIIARSPDGFIVFVEVKTRNDSDPEGGFGAIHAAKRKKLTRTALGYLKSERLLNQRCRFDVIVITIDATRQPTIYHIVNAFEATGVNSMFS
ncbi:YraN family protein [Lacunimicrobium album]